MAFALPDARTQSLLDALADVHETLGHRRPLDVYLDAFAIELERRNVPFERDAALPLWYKGQRLGVDQPVPFLCFGAVIVRLKAGPLERVDDTCFANVVRATHTRLGLLASLGGPRLHVRRVRHQGLVASIDTLAVDPPQASSPDDPVPPM